MANVLIKKKKHRKQGKQTIKTRKHVNDRGADYGHTDRLPCFIKRTMELKRQGWHLYEIADAIAIEYDLEKVPHVATVAGWRKQGMSALTEDIAVLQEITRIDQFNELEQLKAKWLPLATADSLQIKRWVRVQGELQPELCENAIDEQLKATIALVKIMDRQAKLMGLDLEKKVEENKGILDKDAVHLWIIGEVNKGIQAPGVIDVAAEARPILELKSGSEEIDRMEGVK